MTQVIPEMDFGRIVMQLHQNSLAVHTTQFDTGFQATAGRMAQTLMRDGYDAVMAAQMSYGKMYAMLREQAAWLAYIDAIWVYGVACLAVAPLAFLMRRPKKDAGRAMGAH